jgi:hypothetical protein
MLVVGDTYQARCGPTRRPWAMVAEGPKVIESTQGDSQPAFRVGMRLYAAVSKS